MLVLFLRSSFSELFKSKDLAKTNFHRPLIAVEALRSSLCSFWQRESIKEGEVQKNEKDVEIGMNISKRKSLFIHNDYNKALNKNEIKSS